LVQYTKPGDETEQILICRKNLPAQANAARRIGENLTLTVAVWIVALAALA